MFDFSVNDQKWDEEDSLKECQKIKRKNVQEEALNMLTCSREDAKGKKVNKVRIIS